MHSKVGDTPVEALDHPVGLRVAPGRQGVTKPHRQHRLGAPVRLTRTLFVNALHQCLIGRAQM
nr:G305 [uncultured bacterium]